MKMRCRFCSRVSVRRGTCAWRTRNDCALHSEATTGVTQLKERTR